jgi:putative ABC transport system permease protein
MILSVAAGLAYHQLLHRGSKLLAALSGVSVAIVLMFTQLGFQGALYDSAVNAARRFRGEIIMTAGDFETMAFNPPWMPIDFLYAARGVEGVNSAAPFYESAIQVINPTTGHALTCWIYAFSPAMPVFSDPEINSQLDVLRISERALIDLRSRNELGTIAARVPGEKRVDLILPIPAVSVQPVVKVEGVFNLGPTITVDGALITSDLNFYRFLAIPLDRVTLGVVELLPGYDPLAVKLRIQRLLGDRARVFLKDEFIKNEQSYYARATPIGFIFGAGLGVGVVVGIVFISQVLHTMVNDNMREYATLRAIGYGQRFLVIVVTIVAVAISVIAYIPSVVISFFIYRFAGGATRLPMHLTVGYLTEVFVVVITMALVATVLSTNKLKQVDPVDLF